MTCTSLDCDNLTKGKYRGCLLGSLTHYNDIGTLHVDTKVKIYVPTSEGNNYFVTIVKKLIRSVGIIPVNSKAEEAYVVLRFVNYFEEHSRSIFKRLQTDGGTEFFLACENMI